MKSILIAILFAFTFMSCKLQKQNKHQETAVPFKVENSNNIEDELKKLEVTTAIIVQSTYLDEKPLWSSDSKNIAYNASGNWYKFDLTKTELKPANWKGLKIGGNINKGAISTIDFNSVNEYKKVTKHSIRELMTSDSTKIEIKTDAGMGAVLSITKKGKEPLIIWRSAGENCHSISLSPDEKYIAYLCEMNGLFIMKIK